MKTKSIILFLALSLFSLASTAEDPEPEKGRFALCGPDPQFPPPPEATGKYKLGTTWVSADEAELLEDGKSALVGNVELVRDKQAARADRVTYDKKQETIDAQGQVGFWDPGVYWSGERGRLFLKRDEAHFEEGKYRLRGGDERRGHGQAELIKHNSREEVTRFRDVDYTTCEGKRPAWKLETKRLKLDHEEDWGEATHVFLNVKDVPVFYFPYLTFPLSDKRKTGFLPPHFGHSTERGVDIMTPFYWNIAPEYDATFSPRVLSKRGVMLGGQGRYLFPTGLGQLDFEYLPDDKLFDDERYLVAFKHQQSFADEHGRLFLLYNEVSDDEYFEHFGRNLATTSTAVLQQRADIAYGGQFLGLSWGLLGRVQSWDIADKSIVRAPYERLPQMLLQARTPYQDWNLNFEFISEGVYFDRDEDVVGARVDLNPTLSFPMHTPSAFVVPRLGVRHTRYDLDDWDENLFVNRIPQENRASITPENPNRTLPIFSVDSGLFFERDFDFVNSAYLQTLEPRLFYVYIPDSIEQNNFPLFDTSEYDPSFYQLFRENRFRGADRVGDANQVSLALSSRIIDSESGVEHLRLSLGQTVNFADRDVVLSRTFLSPDELTDAAHDCILLNPGVADPQRRRFSCTVSDTDTLSETVGEVTARLADAWSARANLTWDPNDNQVKKGTVGLRFWPDPDTIVNAEYRFRRDITTAQQIAFPRGEELFPIISTHVDQTDVSFHWPLTPQWSILGRWLYSFDIGETLEAVGGIGYNSCCWAIQAVGRQFLIGTKSDGTSEFDNGFYIQLELKGLAGIGKRTQTFLKRSIPGYEDDF